MTDLHYLSLIELAGKLEARDVSSVEATRAQLARIERSQLNAYIKVTDELALKHAQASDKRRTAGQILSVLDGIPIALKDIFDLEGTATTAAMAIRQHHVADRNSTVVQRLIDAGAVILGKLNLAEGVYAEHMPPYGPVINPWHPDRYPGASSSGSGAAVAAGLCYGAISSDTGGSIRIPSAANAVTGLKPTWGRVTRQGTFELAGSLDHVGPITRNAKDAAAILRVIAGEDPLDPTASLRPVPDYLTEIDGSIEGAVVGVDRDWISRNVHPDIVAKVLAAVDVLVSAGASVAEVKFPDPEQIIWDWFEICAAQTALAHQDTYPSQAKHYGPALTSLLELGRSLSAMDLQERLTRRTEFSCQVQMLFEQIDILAIPVFGLLLPTLKRMADIDDDLISTLHRFTCSFTMSGNPTLTMPSGISQSDGTPLAVQFVARHFDENQLLRVGHAFQVRSAWHLRHPDL